MSGSGGEANATEEEEEEEEEEEAVRRNMMRVLGDAPFAHDWLRCNTSCICAYIYIHTYVSM